MNIECWVVLISDKRVNNLSSSIWHFKPFAWDSKIVGLKLNSLSVKQKGGIGRMPEERKCMDSSIINEFRWIPTYCIFFRIVCSCQLKDFLGSKNCCCKCILLESASSSNKRKVYFLPRISRMGLTKNNSLPSIGINWGSNKIKSSIFEASVSFDRASSPVSRIVSICVSICAETWICETWSSRGSESQTFKRRAWNLNSWLNISVVSNSWDHGPLVYTFEALSFLPTKLQRNCTPSSFV